MKLDDHAMAMTYIALDPEIDRIITENMTIGQTVTAILEKGIEIYMSHLTQPDDPFKKAVYALCEPHLSGFRVVVGFNDLRDAQAAHSGVVAAFATTDQGGID